VPGGHGSHGVERPTSPLNVPGGQASHCVCPRTCWYQPAGHGSHTRMPTRNCAEPGSHGSHTHEFQRISFPPALCTVLGSHTAHFEPGQHPFPRPPPARHPSSEKNTASGFSAWYTMKMATAPWITQSVCADAGAGSEDATQSANRRVSADALGRRERDGDARLRRRPSPWTDIPDPDARGDIDTRAAPQTGARASRGVMRVEGETTTNARIRS